MTDKKPTDSEVVKALEEYYQQRDSGYSDYLAYGGKQDENEESFLYFLRDLINLINRLQAENVRLKAERDKEHDYSNHYARMYVKAKAEAYKGCIGKLKGIANAEQIVSIDGEWAISQRMADNLLKEMVGEDNG